MADTGDTALSDMSNIKSWYSKKNIFLTGGSGFLGLCLLEKILRTIPDVGTIYVLLRPKRGKEIKERLVELQKNLVFEKLLENKSPDDVVQIFSKLVPLAGDVGEPNLGISPEDKQILVDNVNVIIHSAATLDFKETLQLNIDVNLLGTRRCLELGKACSKLAVFIHVSSAFVNSFMLDCNENIYPVATDAAQLLSLSTTLTPAELIERTPELLGTHPNTYTLTKQLAEHEVRSVEELFPCTIVRPSMIVGSWREPIPGWTASKNGPQGFLMGAAKGVIRRLPVGRELVYDYVPVDVVVNGMLAAGFHAGVTVTKHVQVYHATSSTSNPFRWSAVEDRVNGFLHKYPLVSAVWYPCLKFLPSLQRYKISAFFVHLIPAILLDLVTRVAGGRPILMKLHRNVNASLDLLEKFIFTEWQFHNDRMLALHKWLSPSDQIHYGVDMKDLVWVDYFDDLTQGARRYLNKETMKNIQKARGKDTMLMALHLGLQAAILGLIWFIFACVLGTTMAKSALVVPIFYILFSFL